jgi:hypothetical protein
MLLDPLAGLSGMRSLSLLVSYLLSTQAAGLSPQPVNGW